MPDYFKDHWSIDFKGVKIWHYFRFDFNGRETSSYKPKLSISILDFIYFIKFISLRFSKVKNVYFIAGRNELLTVVKNNAKNDKAVVFIREDSHGIKGNVFLIELLRWIFRRFSPIVFYSGYRDVLSKLNTCSEIDSVIKASARSAVGDYYFNYFIKYFINGKIVYFSNCVIPKIEKNQKLHNSFEIQHGVIYDNHPDYAQLPPEFYKIKILCWGAYWEKKLLDLGFSSDSILLGIDPFNSYDIQLDKGKVADVGIFTTVDHDFSSVVNKNFNSLSHLSVCIQLHPRDHFSYNNIPNLNFCNGYRPCNFNIAVMHDSTLVYFCVVNKMVFYYLATVKESNEDICNRLKSKYGAEINVNFHIIRNLDELLK